MVAELGVKIDIVKLDTHLFFRESYETRERARRALRHRAGRLIPTVAEHRQEGPNLWERDPDRLLPRPQGRAADPRALQPYDAWISGIRRDQSPSRVDTPQMVWSNRYRVWKLHPLAGWTSSAMCGRPSAANEIPYNPLDSGYRSIGHSLHATDRAGRGRTRRALGGIGQAGMRYPSR